MLWLNVQRYELKQTQRQPFNVGLDEQYQDGNCVKWNYVQEMRQQLLKHMCKDKTDLPNNN